MDERWMGMFDYIIPVAIVIALFLVILIIGYVKAPPDMAYIISGMKKKPKILIGRAGIKIPFLERKGSKRKRMIHFLLLVLPQCKL